MIKIKQNINSKTCLYVFIYVIGSYCMLWMQTSFEVASAQNRIKTNTIGNAPSNSLRGLADVSTRLHLPTDTTTQENTFANTKSTPNN